MYHKEQRLPINMTQCFITQIFYFILTGALFQTHLDTNFNHMSSFAYFKKEDISKMSGQGILKPTHIPKSDC